MNSDHAVWFSPIPISTEYAGKIYAELRRGNISNVASHPSVEAFYNELVTIYPEVGPIPESEINQTNSSPWSLPFDKSSRHLIIFCVWSKAEYVGDLLKSLAEKHGLVLYSPQSKKGYGSVVDFGAAGPPTNPENLRRRVLLAIAPFAFMSAGMMFLFFDQRGWTTSAIVFQSVFIIVCICIFLAAINAQTFWWAPRLIAFIVFAAYFSYLVDDLLALLSLIPAPKRTTNTMGPILGFCVIGIPSLLYSFSGSIFGPISGKINDAVVTKRDLFYLNFVRATLRFFLLSSFILTVIKVVRLLVS